MSADYYYSQYVAHTQLLVHTHTHTTEYISVGRDVLCTRINSICERFQEFITANNSQFNLIVAH